MPEVSVEVTNEMSDEEVALKEALAKAKSDLLQAQEEAVTNSNVLENVLPIIISGDKEGIKKIADIIKRIVSPVLDNSVDILELVIKSLADVLGSEQGKRITELRAEQLGRFKDALTKAGFSREEAYEFCVISHKNSKDNLMTVLNSIPKTTKTGDTKKE